MKTYPSMKAGLVPVLAGLSLFAGAALASAQTMATMPVLYNASGAPVNTGAAALPAGYYYLQAGAQHQVYYYGNGTFYDASTQTYGGSVSDPNGTAGVALGYSSALAVTPGLPNTGAGGMAPYNWAMIAVSGAIAALGASYLVATRRSAHASRVADHSGR